MRVVSFLVDEKLNYGAKFTNIFYDCDQMNEINAWYRYKLLNWVYR